jgi:cyclophilin family peptidyl-prolyl cis-trans isomerase
MTIRLIALALGLFLLATLYPASAAPIYVRFNTNLGNIDVELFADTAPLNVANFMSYVNSGAYNNVVINRSVPGFIFQAGEYVLVSNSSGDSFGSNTPGNPVNSEESLPGAHSNTRGTIAFALSGSNPNSGTNQWFFNEVDNNSASSPADLDSQGFTAFGIVMNTSSLSVMDEISSVPVFLPPNDNPFITPAAYEADTNPGGPSPDDFAFGRIPLLNYTLGNDANPNPVLSTNLVIVSSVTVLTNVQNFTAWQTAKFTNLQQQTPTFIAATATPFNDGVPNLLKYVFDINPSVPLTVTERANLPALGTTTISGTKYLTLTFHQHNALVGVTVNVQTSPDLQTWTTATNPTIVQTGTDANGDPIMQVQVAESGTMQFIRLNVTQP